VLLLLRVPPQEVDAKLHKGWLVTIKLFLPLIFLFKVVAQITFYFAFLAIKQILIQQQQEKQPDCAIKTLHKKPRPANRGCLF
jgi:hypothetical protein